jgi:hypothetical protein
MAEEIPLRITVVAPPPGVTFAVQLGRDELLLPARSAPDMITFDFTVQVARTRQAAALSFRGPAVQGRPSARFVYLNAGRRAGDATSCWDRRGKVSLEGITTELLEAWRAAQGGVLEARVAGTARDGGPACATLPLLDGGWRVRSG